MTNSDTTAIDKIGLILGTTASWSPDTIEEVAKVIESVRPGVVDAEPAVALQRMEEHIGYSVDTLGLGDYVSEDVHERESLFVNP